MIIRNTSGTVVGMMMDSNRGELSMADLPAGLYIAAVQNGAGIVRSKVIR